MLRVLPRTNKHNQSIIPHYIVSVNNNNNNKRDYLDNDQIDSLLNNAFNTDINNEYEWVGLLCSITIDGLGE
jgi:hypothetical protein